MKKEIFIFCFILVSMPILKSNAQSKLFEGTWNRPQIASLFGTEYANGVPEKIKIKMFDDVMQIDGAVVSEDPEKPILTNETIKTNGEQAINSISATRKKETVMK